MNLRYSPVYLFLTLSGAVILHVVYLINSALIYKLKKYDSKSQCCCNFSDVTGLCCCIVNNTISENPQFQVYVFNISEDLSWRWSLTSSFTHLIACLRL